MIESYQSERLSVATHVDATSTPAHAAPMRTIAIAGISGFTGRRMLPLLADDGAVKLLLRPRTAGAAPWSTDARVVGVDLLDEAALGRALAGVDTLVSLVGTTRAQFRAATATEPEVSYETVDIGIPRALARAGAAVGCKRFVLLTSWGIGGPGPYTAAKREAEAAVTASGLEAVFVRPSFIVGEGRASGRSFDPFIRAVGLVARGWAEDARSIDAGDLAKAILTIARADDWSAWRGRGVTGRELHALARA
jgi:uncharacterized protein YbjT (DUF2867 family)